MTFLFYDSNKQNKEVTKDIGLWNDLPLNIRQSQSIASFKNHLKHYLSHNN